jgi:hypothetical protein
MARSFFAICRDLSYQPTKSGRMMRLFSGEDGSPYAHITDLPAGHLSTSHYHPTDQFQIGIEGDAIYYPDYFVGPLDIHYVDSRALYGPFTAGPNGMKHMVLRRTKVGVVRQERPVTKPALEDRQLIGLERDFEWEGAGNGLRRKVLMGRDSNGPVGEIFECGKGAKIETGTAPFGEFAVFYKGTFETEGRVLDGYALRYTESKQPTPPITSKTDGGIIVVAKYDRPVPVLTAEA